METQSNRFGNSTKDFQIYELLGSGGFAQVYRAKSLINGKEVAIKMIDRKVMHQYKMVKRVRREVEIHSQLKHPSIVELFECFEDDNYVYLVLEMCDKGELQGYIRQHGAVSENVARQYLKQIVRGLLYLHSHNILHRDMTLANLLLTKDMKVKIADFGLATTIEPGHNHKTMCGTPNYISPEVASRLPQGLEVDVWSVGCMVYTLLVGQAPFDTREVRSTLTRVISGSYHLPSTLSLEACQLINALLQRQPQDRIKLEAILKHPFMAPRLHIQDSFGDSGIESMNRTPTTPLHTGAATCLSDISGGGHASPTRAPANKRRSRAQSQPPPTRSDPAVLSPLNTRRLRPMRVRMRNKIVSILCDGRVCFENLRRRRGEEVVDEEMFVDPGGTTITIQRAREGCYMPPREDKPVDLPTESAVYLLTNLPERQKKAYQYVSK